LPARERLPDKLAVVRRSERPVAVPVIEEGHIAAGGHGKPTAVLIGQSRNLHLHDAGGFVQPCGRLCCQWIGAGGKQR